jgi:DNA modification methylase
MTGKISDPTQLTYLTNLTVRQVNVLRSPKNNGSARADSARYLAELGVEIINRRQPIQFLPNSNEHVHRWSPYVQGFSASFVQRTLDLYRHEYESPMVLDPFAGSGTVIVQAKLNDMAAYGVELNPLLHFIAETKINSWATDPIRFLDIARHLAVRKPTEAPGFLKSEKHFNPGVLKNLVKLRGGIDSFEPASNADKHIKDLMLLAFASILIDCSNLKRTPCLGYSRSKNVEDDAPFILFSKKIEEIAEDLQMLHSKYTQNIEHPAKVYLANSMEFEHSHTYDLVITSPPYMNGLDYVMNYKIEMGWLGFAENHRQLKRVKDDMVVCDNVSKGLIRNFASAAGRYTNPWIEEIKEGIYANIQQRGSYRRKDMPEIVHKYFDDMYKVMQKVVAALKNKGRFILVIGDSLIADTYLPTDLIIARMGQEMGLTIEKIEKARDRHSGQIRSYKLRETIVTLRKE